MRQLDDQECRALTGVPRRSSARMLVSHGRRHRFLRRCEFIGRAELHELGAGVDFGHMPGRHVKGLAPLDNLITIVVVDDHAASEQIAPVGTATVASGQACQHGSQRVCLGDGNEVHGVTIEVAEPIDGDRVLVDRVGGVLRDGGHFVPPEMLRFA